MRLHKNKKKTLFVITGLVCLVMIFAAIGYAINYSAQTTNVDNKAKVADIWIDQADGNHTLFSASAKVPCDTVTALDGTVTYTVNADTVVSSYNLTINKENIDATTCTVTITTDQPAFVRTGAFTLAIAGATLSSTVGEDGSTGIWVFTGVGIGSAKAVTLTIKDDTVLSAANYAILSTTGIDFTITATVSE